MASKQKGFREQLRAFAAAHRSGWDHQQWLALLAELADAGVDTSKPDAVGAELEHERVLLVLEEAGVKGLGPKRRVALADHFKRLWDLENASVEEIAEIPSFHAALAQAIHDAMH